MNVEIGLNILAFITLIEMMIYVGLSVSTNDIWDTIRDWTLLARGILANYVLFPAVTICLLLFFRPPTLVAVGFMILAVCPAGPYGAPYTAIAKGNVGTAAGLMIILASMSPILSPVLLHLLVPLVSGAGPFTIDVSKLVVTLLLGQVLPLLAGLSVHRLRPQLAAKLLRPAGLCAKILNVVFLLLVVYVQFDSFLAIRWPGFVGMLLLLVASVSIGWMMGGPGRERRKAMALTTSVRNNGVALVVATGVYPGTSVVTVAVVYGLVGVLGGLGFALWWNRQASRRQAVE